MALAIANNDLQAVDAILATGVSPDSGGHAGCTPLMLACGGALYLQAEDRCAALVKNKESTNEDFKKLAEQFISACKKFPEREKIVQRLISAGAHLKAKHSKYGFTALHCCAYAGHCKSVQILLQQGAEVDAVDDTWVSTPLMQAASMNRIDCVKILLTAGIDPNLQDKNGSTVLHYAASQNAVRVLPTLLDANADPNIRNNDGQTPLIRAAVCGYANCAKILLENGVEDIDSLDNWNETAALRAVANGHYQVLDLLIKEGCSLNIRNIYGLTPLILALDLQQRHIADLILSSQRDVAIDAVSRNGNTALSLAERYGFNTIKQKILAYDVLSLPKHHPREKKQNKRQVNPNRQTESLPFKSSVPSAMEDRPPAPYMSAPTTNYSKETSSVPPPPMPSPVDTFAMNSVGSYIPERPSAPFMTKPSEPAKSQGNNALHKKWLISFKDLELGPVLGEGSYAEVYRAKWHGAEVAAKVFKFPSGSMGSKEEFSNSLLHKITEEADLLAAIRHPNVVSFLAMCSDPPCMVTELCSGSLFDMIKRSKTEPALAAKMTWGRRLRMLTDAAAGMSHLHQRVPPTLHRDMKSLNLLVDSAWKVKISDLGLSKLMEEVTIESHAGSTASNMNPRWLAPEVLETGNWLPASDVYAFGVVMWELLTWELPWGHVNNQFLVRMSVFIHVIRAYIPIL